jgi:hypothetical protein
MVSATDTPALAWPPASGAYNYILTLNEEEIGWESLRRNLEYQSYYKSSHAGPAVPQRLPSGQFLWHAPTPSSDSDRWGLHSFR